MEKHGTKCVGPGRTRAKCKQMVVRSGTRTHCYWNLHSGDMHEDILCVCVCATEFKKRKRKRENLGWARQPKLEQTQSVSRQYGQTIDFEDINSPGRER